MTDVIKNKPAVTDDKDSLTGSSQEYWKRIVTKIMNNEEIPKPEGELVALDGNW